MKEHILSVKDLSVAFQSENRETVAVSDISFELGFGEILAIVGESGSGKSVTAMSIMKLLSQASSQFKGKIVFKQGGSPVDILSLSEKEIRPLRGKEIAMIFQEPMTSLNPVMTCGEQVSEAIRLHLKLSRSDARNKTIALFKKVKLPEPERIYSSYPHQISGGQKQRVMIAMAISCEPKVLIADEPTTALDVTVQKTILTLLKELQASMQMSIIFITHDLAVVSEFADRVCVMYKGSFVETGDVNSVFSSSQHPYTKALLKCRPPSGARLYPLPVISDFLESGKNQEQKKSIAESKEERSLRHKKLYSSHPLVTLESVSKTYLTGSGLIKKRKLVAVNNVSIQIFKGETLGLVGESGCGKSTLGNIVARLIEPSQGKITYHQTDLLKLKGRGLRELRKKIQIIFQDPYSSLNPMMRIGEAISEPIWVHRLKRSRKECRSKAIELLEAVGLNESHYNRFPHEFSGGQRQRIVIARALSVNPEFIICDECVSALDVSVQAQVLNLLNNLKDVYGLTYLFISHDLGVVRYFSDRIAIMSKGSIEQIGEADDVYQNPKTEYAQKLLHAVPKLSI